MRSFGVYKGGNSENAPFVVFASFCAQKEEYLSFPLVKQSSVFVSFKVGKKTLAPFALKRKAFVCEPRHSVKVLIVFGDATNEGSS